MSRHAAALISRYRWGQRPLSTGKPIVNWIILLLILAAAILKVLLPIAPASQAQAESRILPAQAADWIVANHPAGKLFNSYNWGGYLLWRLWPEYPSYADGRTDVYSNAFLQEYLQIVTGQRDAPVLFDERGIRTVIVEQESPLVTQLVKSGLWQETYRDEKARRGGTRRSAPAALWNLGSWTSFSISRPCCWACWKARPNFCPYPAPGI